MAQGQAAMINDTITAALAALGDTPDRVAATLRSLGYRGRRMDGEACPVQKYLVNSLPVEAEIGVGDEHVDVDPPMGLRETIPLTAAVAEFVANFDRGLYPDLEIPESR